MLKLFLVKWKIFSSQLKTKFDEDVSLNDVENSLSTTEQRIGQRKSEFVTVRTHLVENDTLCHQFADAAKTFLNFLEVNQTKEKAASKLPNITETIKLLEEVSEALRTSGREKLQELENSEHKLSERQVFENPYTTSSITSLRKAYDSFTESNKKEIEAAVAESKKEKQVLAEEDRSEIEEVFNHFDKDKDGKLSFYDFHGVMSFSEGKEWNEDKSKLLFEQLDTNKSGTIDFNEYYVYASSKRADQDNVGTYLESFNTLAGNKEFITDDDLRRVLPPEQVSYIAGNLPKYTAPNGEVLGYDYKAWLKATHGL